MQTSQAEHETHIRSLNSKIDRQEEEKSSLMLEIQNLRQQMVGNSKTLSEPVSLAKTGFSAQSLM